MKVVIILGIVVTTVYAANINMNMRNLYDELAAPDNDIYTRSFDCADNGGTCRTMSPSGEYCVLYEAVDYTGTCENDNEKCCVHDCADELSGCGSCETPISTDSGSECPDGKILYPGEDCKCFEEGKVCCIVACDTADDDRCRTVFGGLCKPVTCPAGIIGREDSECCGGLKHCKCCKGMAINEGNDIISHEGGGGKGGTGVRGDPILETIDHVVYKFAGLCSYVLMRECSNPTGHAQFKVITKHVRGQDRSNKFMTLVQAVTVFIDKPGGGQNEIEMFIGRDVSINKASRLTFEHSFETFIDGDVTVYKDGTKLCVSLYEVFNVCYNGIGRVDVLVNPDAGVEICGLLGNGNGNRLDDLQKWTSDGLVPVRVERDMEVNTYEILEFGYSWKLSGDLDCQEIIQE